MINALSLSMRHQRAQEIATYLSKHQLRPIGLVLTHSHWDHIADAAKLKQLLHIPISIHPLDRPNLEKPGADRLPLMFAIEGATPDTLLQWRT